jgi:PH (Pleckstrin Homology) domain-containing protein
MRFAAPWDRTNRVSTAIAAVVLVAVPIVVAAVTSRADEGVARAASAIVAVAAAATLGIAWALGPKGYAVLGEKLVVERPLRPVEIPLRTIRAVGPLPDGVLRGSVKVAGSSGLFGWYGRFWNRRLGGFRAYATRRDGLVLVEAGADRFVLSPEPADRFLEAVLARAPSASRAAPDAPLAPNPVARRTKLWLAGAIALGPLLAGGVFAAIWAFTPVSARIEGGDIRIERHLAPAVEVPIAEVRRAERLGREYARRLGRVSGTAAGHARWGHFRSPDLGDVQLYAWRGDGYVLLDTADRRIVLTPDDPDAFVAAVRAGMAR